MRSLIVVAMVGAPLIAEAQPSNVEFPPRPAPAIQCEADAATSQDGKNIDAKVLDAKLQRQGCVPGQEMRLVNITSYTKGMANTFYTMLCKTDGSDGFTHIEQPNGQYTLQCVYKGKLGG